MPQDPFTTETQRQGGKEVLCNSKVHILTVAKYPLGGIRTYLKYTYGHLDRRKYRFTIVAMRRGQESDLIPGDLSGFEVDLRETDEAAGNRGLLRSTRQALRRSHVDLIHSQGLTSGILAILANWRARRPHVITHHDVFRGDQFGGLRGDLKQHLMAIVLSRADVIVCVTEDARRNFSEFLPSFPAEKLTVVPNGIDTAPFTEAAERRRRGIGRLRRPDSSLTFGFFGRFMPQKGFDILIDAVAELARSGAPSRPFRVLAANQGDCFGRYKAEIRRRGLEAFFEFPGFTNSVAEALCEVGAVVMPSRWEAAGLVAMEAMVAGCPLISSDCIGLREVVHGTPALVARADDPNSLAERMKTAMNCESELGVVFCDFASIARERFDVRWTAAAMEQVFSRLARCRRDALSLESARELKHAK
jgi:glycosyltransferase involved in cell wall biosynthesis